MKLLFLVGKFPRDVAFYRCNLNCFSFDDVVNSCYLTPSVRFTHCFHFVTNNKHKVLKLPRALQLVLFSALLQSLVSVSL